MFIIKDDSRLELQKGRGFIIKTEMHKACRFSFTIVGSNGEDLWPITNRGEGTVYVFLYCLTQKEEALRAMMTDKKLIYMTCEDWEKHKNWKTAIFATEVWLRISYSTQSLCMTMVHAGIAAKST